MSLTVQTFAPQDQASEQIAVDTLMHQVLKDKDPRSSLAAFDMDANMFKNDVGVMVFLEKLAQPTFWKFSVERFYQILLPNDYRKVLMQVVNGEIPGLAPEGARKMLEKAERIKNLYALQKRLLESNGNGHALGLENPIVNEFALQMITFDDYFFQNDHIIAPLVGHQFLMRTRFFAGKNLDEVSNLTMQAMQRRHNSSDRIASLRVDPSSSEEENGGVESLEIDRLIMVNDAVRRLVMRVFMEERIDTRVVSMNLKQIVDTTVQYSPYAVLKHQRKGVVLATKLGGSPESLDSRTLGTPLHGIRKVEELRLLEGKIDKKVILASGDSATSDTPMGVYALTNGGVFVITGDDYGKTREKFEPRILADLKQRRMVNPNTTSLNDYPEIAERVWFLKMTPVPIDDALYTGWAA